MNIVSKVSAVWEKFSLEGCDARENWARRKLVRERQPLKKEGRHMVQERQVGREGKVKKRLRRKESFKPPEKRKDTYQSEA